MNIAEWLARSAHQFPANPALGCGTQVLRNYSGFFRDAAGFATWLHENRVRPGDRVLIFARNHPDYLIAKWGAWIAGATVVPANAMLHGAEVAWIAKNTGARLAVVSEDLGAQLAAHCDLPMISCGSSTMSDAKAFAPMPVSNRRPEDVAWLFYTSGTTGRPKGVCITHGMLTTVSIGYLQDVDEVSAQDAIYYAGPMSHGAGLYGPVHVLKGAMHIAPESESFDPSEILRDSTVHGSTSMFLAPTMVSRLTNHAVAIKNSGHGIRTIVYGGGPMYVADLERALDQFGSKFVQIYGQGECPMAITVLPRHEIGDRTCASWATRVASVGRAQSTVAVAIADENGTHLPPGTTGEIVVRGLPVMPGYWQNPEATAETLVEGWLRTGDLGRMDADGYLTLIDRSKDLIISGGSNVYPREVEEAILTHPSVAEVSVVGRPHPDWGEEVVAFVVPSAGAEVDAVALNAHCNGCIGRYKRPKEWIAIDTLPKNNYGKVLKTELRARLLDPSSVG